MKKKIEPTFLEELRFELPTEYISHDNHPSREPQAFEKLKASLLEKVLSDTELLSLHQPLKAAANEAAALSWTTPYPILVFPVLLAEKIHQTRRQAHRQSAILARSEPLMNCAI